MLRWEVVYEENTDKMVVVVVQTSNSDLALNEQ
jgi:hypothetical protein